MSQPSPQRAFAHLFEPLDVGARRLRHRLNFGAHTANMSVDGLPGEQHLHYYLERARGGAAMIVVEPVPVHPKAVLTRGNFRAASDDIIPHFRPITAACQAEGALMIQQLYHVGAHGDWDNSFEPNWSPSGRPSMHDGDGSHAMSVAEIAETVEAFAAAAHRAQRCGFDGIEIMAGYNALLEQFWSSFCNRRDDRYGGSFDNRMRFAGEVYAAIRKRCGEDFVLGIGVAVDPSVPEVQSIEDLQAVARWLDERTLVDYISVGTGGYFDFTQLMPTVFYADKLGPPHAEAIRSVGLQHAVVQAESHIRTPENADYAIASGQADMVSIVRGQIADPQLANKARAGRAEDIRPCLSCNQQCWGRRSRDYWISCLINPSAGREGDWGSEPHAPAATPKNLLVVGGGPAGLECARVAASRGHRVTLAEAGERLGGQFRLAGLQPRREQILDYLDWQERQLQQLGVELRLNSYLDADEVRAAGADAVVVATGSLPAETGYQRGLPVIEALPGVARGNVCSAEDVMSRNARPGRRVLLLDDLGNWKAGGTAWHLAEQGHAVSIVTHKAVIGAEITRTAADIPLRMRLKSLGAAFFTESALREWRGDAALIVDLLDGSERELPFDTLVLATANQPFDELLRALADSGIEAQGIGDCVAPRQAAAAIFEGRRLGLAL